MLSDNNRLLAQKLLKQFYGYDRFRPMQLDVISHIISGQDALVLMPTGGGKSICFQIPALMFDGCTIVVSPLLALMKDQVDTLRTNGVPAAAVNSMQLDSTNREIIEHLFEGKIKLLYISPERLLSEIDKWSKMPNISLIAIDEAHCISQWGHDFRPEYTNLASLKSKFPSVPIMALTATADRITREDIIKQLQIDDAKVFISSFDRPNLSLSVISNLSRIDKNRYLLSFINKRIGQSGIVYCQTRSATEDVADLLRAHGFKAKSYHAGMTNDVRQRIQQEFLNDDVEIICATIAFGMGIDKSNIRWIVHYNMPKNIECYYQEIGRAGRDGLPADALMFYSYSDIATLNYFADNSGQIGLNKEKLQRIQEFAESGICRRRILLSYFNERFDHDCNNCDVCLNPPEKVDGTEIVQMALSGVVRMCEKEGIMMLIDVLRGSRKAAVIEKGYNNLKTFGVGGHLPSWLWGRYILQMIQLGLLELVYNENNHLKITPYGWDVLKGKCKVMLTIVKSENIFKSRLTPKYSKKVIRELSPKEILTDKLKSLRLSIAKENEVPAYIIFSDKVIVEIVDNNPATFKELSEIQGLGMVKVARFGVRILTLLRNHNNLSVKGLAEELTLFLINRGFDINKIAELRGLKTATIANHISKAIQLGRIFPSQYSHFISREDYQRIIDGYRKHSIDYKKENNDKVIIALAIYRKNTPK